MANRGDRDHFPVLPAIQLVGALEDLERRRSQDMGALCKCAGISDRTLREWRNGERLTMLFHTADKVLTRTGLIWWEVWTEQNTPEDQWARVSYAFTGEWPDQDEQLELAA